MNCELCNDKIVIVPPPTVCFSCASTLQNLRATIDRLRAELAAVSQCYKSLVDTEIFLRSKVTELQCGFEIEGHVNDRLRAENESLHQQLDTVSEAHNVMAKEGDRLRAENAELQSRLNDFTDPKTPGMVSVGLLNVERETGNRLRAERDALLAEKNHLKDWKERAFKAEDEIDRLRAEIAELRTFIKNFAYSEELSGRSMRLFANAAYELLAKTAKEGE